MALLENDEVKSIHLLKVEPFNIVKKKSFGAENKDSRSMKAAMAVYLEALGAVCDIPDWDHQKSCRVPSPAPRSIHSTSYLESTVPFPPSQTSDESENIDLERIHVCETPEQRDSPSLGSKVKSFSQHMLQRLRRSCSKDTNMQDDIKDECGQEDMLWGENDEGDEPEEDCRNLAVANRPEFVCC